MGADVSAKRDSGGPRRGFDLFCRRIQPRANQIRIQKLLVALGLAASNAEANRKIAEKAVKLDGETTTGALVALDALPARLVVRLGKRAKVAVIAKVELAVEASDRL